MGTFKITIGGHGFQFDIEGNCLDYIDMPVTKGGYYKRTVNAIPALELYGKKMGIDDIETLWRADTLRLIQLREPRDTKRGYEILGYIALPHLKVLDPHALCDRKNLVASTKKDCLALWDWGFDRDESEWRLIVLPNDDDRHKWWNVYKEKMDELGIQKWFESLDNFKNYVHYMEMFFKYYPLMGGEGVYRRADLMYLGSVSGNRPTLVDGQLGLVLPSRHGDEYNFYPLNTYRHEGRNLGNYAFERRNGYLLSPIIDEESDASGFTYWMSGYSSDVQPMPPMWLVAEGRCDHLWGVLSKDIELIPSRDVTPSMFDYNFACAINI